MKTLEIIVAIVVVLVVLALIASYAMRRRRSHALRERFGPEYDRAVGETRDQSAAEAELEARTKRVERLDIHPLQPAERDRFAAAWKAVQARFVDEPRAAVADADRLVAEVMAARGYPMGDFEQRAADVSVDHPEVVDHYRLAHRIAQSGTEDTESLRQAMVHERALFSDLLEVSESPSAARSDGTSGRSASDQGVAEEGRTTSRRAP